MKKIIILVCFFCFISFIALSGYMVSASSSITIYVDASNQSGIEDGSPEDPFNTIMEGIGAAFDGDTVQVAAGTYYENVVMKAGVDLIGVGANMVTIDAEGSGNVIEGADRCTIDGFTITNGGPDYPYSGINCPSFCSMLITNNIVTGCTNGIYCSESSSIISNNMISNNGNPNNATTDFAICCNNSSLTISNNLIMDNLEVAIYTSWSGSDSAIILNNTIANNVDDHGVWCYESSPTIKNNIIVGNDGGIVAIYSSFPKISYNDVWNNTWADYEAQTGSICEPGIGDISDDPMFIDASNGDYHLRYNSPCIDAGTNALELPDYDFDGDSRILDGDNDGTAVVDMGADEYVIIYFNLTIEPSTGGTTVPSPDVYSHPEGTEVQVEAVPNSGYQFTGWSGDASGTANPITLTVDSDKSITANFSVRPPPEEDGKDGGCFIATAAYGSPLHPYVMILRDFRDKYLMSNNLGRKFVDLYYEYSPFAADLIARNKPLKVIVRIHLIPIIVLSYSMIHLGPITTGVFLFLVIMIPILPYLRRN